MKISVPANTLKRQRQKERVILEQLTKFIEHTADPTPAGKEPMLTNAGNIVCRYCHDPERYNPEKETLSNKLSECPNKKTVCIKEKTDRIECEEPYDKDDPNAKFKMDRQCRCSYEEDMIPKFYFFGRDTWTCSYPEVMKCLHVPCPMSEDGKKQTRGRDS